MALCAMSDVSWLYIACWMSYSCICHVRCVTALYGMLVVSCSMLDVPYAMLDVSLLYIAC